MSYDNRDLKIKDAQIKGIIVNNAVQLFIVGKCGSTLNECADEVKKLCDYVWSMDVLDAPKASTLQGHLSNIKVLSSMEEVLEYKNANDFSNLTAEERAKLTEAMKQQIQ